MSVVLNRSVIRIYAYEYRSHDGLAEFVVHELV